nr:hypothetical protein CFP56_54611 [Quercus suber]
MPNKRLSAQAGDREENDDNWKNKTLRQVGSASSLPLVLDSVLVLKSQSFKTSQNDEGVKVKDLALTSTHGVFFENTASHGARWSTDSTAVYERVIGLVVCREVEAVVCGGDGELLGEASDAGHEEGACAAEERYKAKQSDHGEVIKVGSLGIERQQIVQRIWPSH